MDERLRKQPSKGKLVEHNINKLATLQKEKSSQLQSPAWIHLQAGSSRVKKLSKLFEGNSNAFHTKPNWWLLDETIYKASSSASPTPKPRASIGRLSSNSPKHNLTKLDRIVHEFLQKELSYIDALERGIATYLDIVKNGDDEVPAVLRYQTFRLFGNIEDIYKLHKESVYPQLLNCNGNPRLIAETISSFIQNEQFYCYVVYAVNQKSAEQLISHHLDFFEALRSSSDDLLGINSFTIQPIQKLPRYKMLFDELIKELGRDILVNKETAAACCIAEKNIKRLLVRLDEALAINDIIEVNVVSIEEQMNTITTLQNLLGLNINEPMMLLVPKTSQHFPSRSPFNINDLGRFYKATTMKAYEFFSDRSFTSKVFLFEKCLLYTRVVKDNTLGYRNHFMFNSGLGFTSNESQVSFRVNEASKKHDVIFSSDHIESIAEMKKLIKQFHDPRRSNDSAYDEGTELMTENALLDGSWVLADCCSNKSLGEGLFKTMLKRLKNSN